MEELRVPSFTMEASSLPLIFNLVSATSFLFTLICFFVLSPRIRLYLVKVCGELPKHSTSNFDTLLASTVHAIVAVVLASYSLAFGLLGTYRVFSKSPLGFMTIQMSLGYFVADLLITLVDPKLRSDKGSIAHHVTGIVGIITCLYLQGKLMFFIISRLISEASTPFVNMRWVLHELHITDGSLFKTAAYGMLVTFFATRIATMPWYWYETYHCFMHPGIAIVPDFIKVCTLCNFGVFDLLNLYWFSKIVLGLIKFYSKHKDSKQ